MIEVAVARIGELLVLMFVLDDDPKVRALQEDPQNKKIAIGTRSAFTHFQLFNLFDCSCDVSKTKSGALVAVGCKNGHVLIWDVEKLIALHSIEDRSKEITVLKFSPAGDRLAVGAADHRIRIYKMEGPTKFKLISECKDHRAAVTHIDWSSNGQLIQSCSEDNEHLFFNPDTGASIANGASVYKDMEWETWTLTVGWPVIGIWPITSNGKDIRSVCRGSKSKILVTSDSFGKVKLFKYPSITPFASYNSYSGHSSVVSEVRLSLDEKYLFSLGRNDKCIFQWRVTTLEEEQLRIKQQEELDAEFDSSKKQSLKASIADEQQKLIANKFPRSTIEFLAILVVWKTF